MKPRIQFRRDGVYVNRDGHFRRVVEEHRLLHRNGETVDTVTFSKGGDKTFTILRDSFRRWAADAVFKSGAELADSNIERISYGETPPQAAA